MAWVAFAVQWLPFVVGVLTILFPGADGHADVAKYTDADRAESDRILAGVHARGL